jgi:hypothetical protein
VPGCEAATQTFCPLVEQCTTKKLTINIETANVNCPSKNCEHNVDTCKRNYSTGESMASGYGSNFKYSLAIDGVKVFFFNKLGFCGSHRLAGTVISLACKLLKYQVSRQERFTKKV